MLLNYSKKNRAPHEKSFAKVGESSVEKTVAVVHGVLAIVWHSLTTKFMFSLQLV